MLLQRNTSFALGPWSGLRPAGPARFGRRWIRKQGKETGPRAAHRPPQRAIAWRSRARTCATLALLRLHHRLQIVAAGAAMVVPARAASKGPGAGSGGVLRIQLALQVEVAGSYAATGHRPRGGDARSVGSLISSTLQLEQGAELGHSGVGQVPQS